MPAGRKNKYVTHVEPRLDEIEWWKRDGLTEAEICKRLGIGVSIFAEYKKAHSELLGAIKKGGEIADFKVEDSLFQRATGMPVEETHEEFKDGELVSVKKVHKHLAPDPTSMIFWLKNRKSKQWRDKQEIGGQVTILYNVPEIEKEE